MEESGGIQGSVVKSVRREDRASVLVLQGDVDLHQANTLRTALLEVVADKPSVLVIDMGEVNFMDSSGLATLVEALQLTRRNGGQLRLAGLGRRVRSIFEIARLDTIFEVYETQGEALAE